MVYEDARKVQEHIDEAFSSARNIIGEINRLVIGLETGTGKFSMNNFLFIVASTSTYDIKFIIIKFQ